MEFKKYDWGQELKHDWAHVEITNPNTSSYCDTCGCRNSAMRCAIIGNVSMCLTCLKELVNRVDGTHKFNDQRIEKCTQKG